MSQTSSVMQLPQFVPKALTSDSHRLREAMGNDPVTDPTLLGVVEADATLVDGKVKGRGRAYKGNKTIVAGAVYREGGVRLERIPDVKQRSLHDFTARTVKDEAEAIYTNELKPYLRIADGDTRHETVNHLDRGTDRERRP